MGKLEKYGKLLAAGLGALAASGAGDRISREPHRTVHNDEKDAHDEAQEHNAEWRSQLKKRQEEVETFKEKERAVREIIENDWGVDVEELNKPKEGAHIFVINPIDSEVASVLKEVTAEVMDRKAWVADSIAFARDTYSERKDVSGEDLMGAADIVAGFTTLSEAIQFIEIAEQLETMLPYRPVGLDEVRARTLLNLDINLLRRVGVQLEYDELDMQDSKALCSEKINVYVTRVIDNYIKISQRLATSRSLDSTDRKDLLASIKKAENFRKIIQAIREKSRVTKNQTK